MTDWMTAQGHLTMDERILLRRLSLGAGALATLLNIGVEYGASTHCLGQGGGRIVGLDLDVSKFTGTPQGFDLDLIEADSTADDTFARLGRDYPGGFSVIFVDGDHSYRGVTADARYARYLIPGGVIAFHDCYNWPVEGKIPPGVRHGLVPGVDEAVCDWINDAFWEQDYVDSIRWFRKL